MGVCGSVYLDGCVPLAVLRRLLVVRFLGFGLVRFVLLLRHLHHCVLWLLQLSPFLGGSFTAPSYLQAVGHAGTVSDLFLVFIRAVWLNCVNVI